jgi:hypothetical protein
MIDQAYKFGGSVREANGKSRPISIAVSAPMATPDGLYLCEIHSDLLEHSPHRVYSALEHDAWAAAFEMLNQVLQRAGANLFDERGSGVELPSPPRDRSWIRPSRMPSLAGLEPIYRVEGWSKQNEGGAKRVELAIWPPFEEEPGTYCAPMRCGLMRGGQVICSYGATAEQSVYLAYKYLQLEVECRPVVDDNDEQIEIPVPPEPRLLAP